MSSHRNSHPARSVFWSAAIGFAAVACLVDTPPNSLDPFGPDEALAAVQSAPFDRDNFVEIRSGENTVMNSGITHYSRVSFSNDIWLLEQRSSRMGEDEWEHYAILVRDGTAYFASLDEGTLLGAECVICHPNGPRALRGKFRAGNPELIALLNQKVERAGPIRAHIPPFDPLPELERLPNAPCVQCHNGNLRSPLYAFQSNSIDYQWLRGHMPLGIRMTERQEKSLNNWIMTNR